MEVLNNHQLVKQNRKVCVRYRSREHSLRNEQKDPASIDSYSIKGNDLILTHKKYYDRRLDAVDSFRDWKLINVDMRDCDRRKLSRLVKDLQIEEIKIVEIKNGKKLIFYSQTEVYIFRCKDIEQEIRGHSHKEFVHMLQEKEEYINEIEIENTKLYEFVTRLCRFINGESRDHKNLFELHRDKNIVLAIKSMHYVEMLTIVREKLEDLKKGISGEMLKYFAGIPGPGQGV